MKDNAQLDPMAFFFAGRQMHLSTTPRVSVYVKGSRPFARTQGEKNCPPWLRCCLSSSFSSSASLICKAGGQHQSNCTPTGQWRLSVRMRKKGGSMSTFRSAVAPSCFFYGFVTKRRPMHSPQGRRRGFLRCLDGLRSCPL